MPHCTTVNVINGILFSASSLFQTARLCGMQSGILTEKVIYMETVFVVSDDNPQFLSMLSQYVILRCSTS